MRAREPDLATTLTREGVDVAYGVFDAGCAGRTIVFTAIDPVVDSRAWRAQIPFLAAMHGW